MVPKISLISQQARRGVSRHVHLSYTIESLLSSQSKVIACLKDCVAFSLTIRDR